MRLTNGFSKKIEMHAHSIARTYASSNVAMIHQTLQMTSAMAASMMDPPWEIGDLVALLENGDHL